MRRSSGQFRSSSPRERSPSSPRSTFRESVFLNCPFDGQYQSLFRPIVFTVHDSGFTARCALEAADSSQNRYEKILGIIAESRLGIHDISRTELDESRLPRLNMPLELGLFLGCGAFGSGLQRTKECLVLDRQKYRYQKFISDIAGQDVASHGGTIMGAVVAVRDWLWPHSDRRIPSGSVMKSRFDLFRRELPRLCREAGTTPAELTYLEFVEFVTAWLKVNR